MAPPSPEKAPGAGITRSGELSGGWRGLYKCLAAALGLFTLWSAGPGIAEEQFLLGFYTLATWMLTFLLFPRKKGIRWTPPSWSDWVAAGALTGLVAAAIFRAEEVAARGASAGDWLLWIAAAAAAARAARRPQALDLALMALSGVCLTYYMGNYLDLLERVGAWTVTDFWMAVLAITLAIEAARRGLSPWIPAIALFAMFYAHFGWIFPDLVAYRGSTVHQIMNYTFFSNEGIFGVMTNVMAVYVLVFIYLGAFMNRSGMGKFFIEMPLSLAGRSSGGPAKVAVIASAVFGSISGSSLANIVSTGTFTIPLMKRVGFRPHVAGAIENSASLGGQLLPPVMGSGAFVMAEITGVPYLRIMAIAAVPALLYFLSIGVIVHLEAKRRGIRGIPPEEMKRPGEVFRKGWFHLVPLAVLLTFLIYGFSPDYCAVLSMASIVLINWLRRGAAALWPERFEPPEEFLGLRGILNALVEGTENSLIVGSSAAAVGIIVGMVGLTGMGLKMSYLLVAMSGGSLLLALVLVALASLVLGMALPITAAYLVLVVLAGPALENFGLPLIAAHMIVFWLSQDSNITPPVCLGAYVAASIASADPWRTGWTSFRFAKMLYVLPLLFAYTPILMTGPASEVVWTMASATAGTVAFSAWTMGHLHRRTRLGEWLLLGVAAALCFAPVTLAVGGEIPGYALNLAGAGLLGAGFLWQWKTPAAEVETPAASA